MKIYFQLLQSPNELHQSEQRKSATQSAIKFVWKKSLRDLLEAFCSAPPECS